MSALNDIIIDERITITEREREPDCSYCGEEGGTPVTMEWFDWPSGERHTEDCCSLCAARIGERAEPMVIERYTEDDAADALVDCPF